MYDSQKKLIEEESYITIRECIHTTWPVQEGLQNTTRDHRGGGGVLGLRHVVNIL